MKKFDLKSLLVFVICFVMYYLFGTELIYLLLKSLYKYDNDFFPSYIINNEEFRERGLANIAQFISSLIITISLVVIYFKELKDHFKYLKSIKLIFKTIGYALLIYLVTICYNLFLPFFGGSGEDGSNVTLIKESMKYQYALMFLLVVIIGPIIEEFLFRFLTFKFFDNKVKINIILLVSSILFTIPHMFSLANSSDLLGDLLALPKFIIIGWMLGNYYYKNKEIGRVILIHMVYNIISFALMSVSLNLL